MAQWRSDLPAESDRGFVTPLVAVLVFMAALALSANSYISGLLANWDRAVQGTLTVQVSGDDSDAADRAVTAVIAAAKAHPAVTSAALVDEAHVRRLLEPWIGAESLVDVPLPLLVDVTLRDTTAAAAEAVSAAIRAAVPAVTIDDHRVWLNRVAGLGQGLAVIAWVLLGLLTGGLGLTVVFATKSNLARQSPTIEVLHLVGAKDSYVAWQFARRAGRQAFIGGAVGLGLYLPALLLLAWLASRIEPGLLPRVSFNLVHWAIIALLPLITGALAIITANFTVRRSLSAMV